MPASRLHVLVSEPNSGNTVYAPYVWALLKSWFERNSALQDRVAWLDPIFKSRGVEQALEAALQQRIDVLGLSCYAWNFGLQTEIAQQVKRRYPECLVVMGGPEPDLKDPAFAASHPYVDIVVEHEGEVPFQRILEARLGDADEELRGIPGLALRSPDGATMQRTSPPEKLTRFDHSPYSDQLERLTRLLADVDRSDFGAVLETNRGCPYRCSFCDWGSATNSRVRRFAWERVQRDIECLAQIDTTFFMLADANFGILPRDQAIAELICAASKTHGAPRGIIFSASKNRSDRNLAIARTLHEGNLLPAHYLSIQHTEEVVLAAGERSNISPKKQMLAAKELARSGIPMTVQLIQGQPGDTPELWRTCLTRLMEWGIHAQLQIYPFLLLPNAPAAQPDYVQKWGLQTRDGLFQTTVARCPLGATDGLLRFRTLIATKSYTSEDWIDCNVLGVVCEALHFCGPTQLLARYLRHSHGVAYRSLYDALFDEFLPRSPWLQGLLATVRDHYRRFLSEDVVYSQTTIEEVPGFPFHVTLTQWFFSQLVLQRDRFYQELGDFLLERFPEVGLLPRVLAYQQQLLISPDYDSCQGHSFPVDYDWPAYFAASVGSFGHETFPEPERAPGSRVRISDTRFGPMGISSIAWGSSSREERRVRWLENVAVITNFCFCALFEELSLEPAQPAQAAVVVPVGSTTSVASASTEPPQEVGVSALLHVRLSPDECPSLATWAARLQAKPSAATTPTGAFGRPLRRLLGLARPGRGGVDFLDHHGQLTGQPLSALAPSLFVQRRADVCRALHRREPKAFVLLSLQGFARALRSVYCLARDAGLHGGFPEFLRNSRQALLELLDFDALLGLYQRTFGAARVLVLPGELLQSDPEACWRVLADRMGVDPGGASSVPEPVWAGPTRLVEQNLRRYTRTVASWSRSLVLEPPRSVAAIPQWLQRQRRRRMRVETPPVPSEYLEAFRGKAALLDRNASFGPWRSAYLLDRS